MKKTRILVVEDALATGAIIKWQIAPLGEVLLVANEAAAIKAIPWLKETRGPTATIMDLGLPGLQGAVDPDAGFRVLKALYAVLPTTPATVLTVRNDQEAYEKCKSIPSVWYFWTKPWDSGQLKADVRACLDGTRPGGAPLVKGQIEGLR